MDRSLVDRLAAVHAAGVDGTFFRHAALNRDAFAGGADGRWGRDLPVIYLGRPPGAVVAEAYRHLVDQLGMPPERVQPRILYTVRVSIERVLDLTIAANLAAVGLTPAALRTDVDDYEVCQAVGAAADQLEFHAILAPAATGLGQTLAIFRARVSSAELPVVQSQILWEQLPPDPRQLGAVRQMGADPTP